MTGPDLGARLILASSSPRRAAILGEAGIEFSTVDTDIDEDGLLAGSVDIAAAVQRVALEKARSVVGPAPDVFVLGADTVVVLDGHMLGKPVSPGEAVDMLRRMSGRTHDVITGVAVVGPGGGPRTRSVSTSVSFRELGGGEIGAYVASGLPFDRAGGYGIQDSSFAPVKSYDECYLNVVGLPMCVTSELLENTGLLPPGDAVCRGHARFGAVGTKVHG